MQGIKDGFHVGFNYEECRLQPACRNMQSAYDQSQVAADYLARECSLGRVVGPIPHGMVPKAQINRFGVIPKSHQRGWRLIVDLSYPKGGSVNDGISPVQCSLSYASVDDAAEHILSLGQEAQLAKIDIKSAYRIVPVYPDDCLLLGMSWGGQLYLDATLPFGLRSAPKFSTP